MTRYRKTWWQSSLVPEPRAKARVNVDGCLSSSPVFFTGGFGGACIPLFLIPYQGELKEKEPEGLLNGRAGKNVTRMHAKEKAELREAHIRSMNRAWVHLRAVELDLQVLRSEFSPNLHQINAQLHELVTQMQQDGLDNQGKDNGQPGPQPTTIYVDGPPHQNGGQETADRPHH